MTYVTLLWSFVNFALFSLCSPSHYLISSGNHWIDKSDEFWIHSRLRRRDATDTSYLVTILRPLLQTITFKSLPVQALHNTSIKFYPSLYVLFYAFWYILIYSILSKKELLLFSSQTLPRSSSFLLWFRRKN